MCDLYNKLIEGVCVNNCQQRRDFVVNYCLQNMKDEISHQMQILALRLSLGCVPGTSASALILNLTLRVTVPRC